MISFSLWCWRRHSRSPGSSLIEGHLNVVVTIKIDLPGARRRPGLACVGSCSVIKGYAPLCTWLYNAQGPVYNIMRSQGSSDQRIIYKCTCATANNRSLAEKMHANSDHSAAESGIDEVGKNAAGAAGGSSLGSERIAGCTLVR